MICIKCKSDIPDDAIFCCYCGKKQTATKAKYHKREHGTGSITKDSRNKRPWIARAAGTSHGTGRIYLGSYATRAEAQAAIDEFIRKGRPALYSASLSEIHEHWKAAHYKTVGKKAEQLYDSLWKRFEPIQDIPVRDLRTPDFQRVIDTATSKSAADTLKVISVMLCDYAVKNDIIEKNYAEFTVKPKFEKKEKKIFSSEDIRKLWQHSSNPNVQAVLIMIYTGFRIGEIVSIRKSDIHLADGYIIGGEKTDAGKNRIVPLPPNIPEIAEFIAAQRDRSDGDILYPYTVWKFRKTIFDPALDTADLSRDYTPHSTRHTFASLSAAAGMQPENLQRIIGHSNFSTTADVYIHQDIDTLRNEMSKITK